MDIQFNLEFVSRPSRTIRYFPWIKFLLKAYLVGDLEIQKTRLLTYSLTSFLAKWHPGMEELQLLGWGVAFQAVLMIQKLFGVSWKVGRIQWKR
jgi:hypothetical protein